MLSEAFQSNGLPKIPYGHSNVSNHIIWFSHVPNDLFDLLASSTWSDIGNHMRMFENIRSFRDPTTFSWAALENMLNFRRNNINGWLGWKATTVLQSGEGHSYQTLFGSQKCHRHGTLVLQKKIELSNNIYDLFLTINWNQQNTCFFNFQHRPFAPKVVNDFLWKHWETVR